MTIEQNSNNFLDPQINMDLITYREALWNSMDTALKNDPRVIILGQGVDDHKGIFGSTKGLAEKYGSERVFDTPLAEEGVTGIAIGAALNGLYPITTHIRVDFSLLAMNQVVNLAAKYKYMFGGKFSVPMLIRMVIGRSWGQGAQHSQSLQSLYAHFPGLTVIMPASASSIENCYAYAISQHQGPVISIEHRLMYDLKYRKDQSVQSQHSSPSPFTSYKVRSGKDVTIVATSIMVMEALRSAEFLSQVSHIDCEVIDLNCLSHPDQDLILASVAKTGKLLVADTSWIGYGVSAEVCRLICEKSPQSLKAPVSMLGMQAAPCPTAKSLEDLFYPNLHDLSDAIAKLVTGQHTHGIPLPDERSFADVYKRFKGPF